MKNIGILVKTYYFYVIFMAKQLILKKKINKNVENVSKFDKKKMI